jgi:mannosylglycoprotein endo-beta-mannosidase
MEVGSPTTDKRKRFHNHFSSVMGHGTCRSWDLKWDNLNLGNVAFDGIDDPFWEEDILNVISQMPSDKAPMPDVLPELSSKNCLSIIKEDIMGAIHQFNNLHVAHLQWVKSANIVLLPKKDGIEEVNDYRPISLIHTISKIIAKMIATQLASLMCDLVSNAQSAFIKKEASTTTSCM